MDFMYFTYYRIPSFVNFLLSRDLPRSTQLSEAERFVKGVHYKEQMISGRKILGTFWERAEYYILLCEFRIFTIVTIPCIIIRFKILKGIDVP